MKLCMQRLARFQEQGDLAFAMYGGQSLAAMTNGGFHGDCGMDGDLDVKMVSGLYGTIREHCPDYKRLDADPAYQHLPSFKASLQSVVLPFLSKKYDIVNKSVLAGSQAPCICEWEGFEVICPPMIATQERYGDSWWVPLMSGGKNIGKGLKHYMNPAHPQFWYWQWNWATAEGLRKGMDRNKDSQVSLYELLFYARASNRMNLLWLDATIQEQPCTIVNAQLHLNHTWHHIQIGDSLRQKCSNACRHTSDCLHNASVDLSCHESNWVTYQRIWHDLQIASDRGSCAKSLSMITENVREMVANLSAHRRRCSGI